MCRDVRDISPILKEIFPSAEMASYLARRSFSDGIPCQRNYAFDDAPPEKLPLRRKDIRDAIAYAAIPLNRKRDLFLQLASGKDTAYFRRQASKIEAAIRGMQPKSGEFFYLKACCYIDEGGMRRIAWSPISLGSIFGSASKNTLGISTRRKENWFGSMWRNGHLTGMED